MDHLTSFHVLHYQLYWRRPALKMLNQYLYFNVLCESLVEPGRTDRYPEIRLDTIFNYYPHTPKAAGRESRQKRYVCRAPLR